MEPFFGFCEYCGCFCGGIEELGVHIAFGDLQVGRITDAEIRISIYGEKAVFRKEDTAFGEDRMQRAAL